MIPILVIMGIVTVYIVISLTALNHTQPLAQTTSAEPQTTSNYPFTTTIVKRNTSKTIYLNNTQPAIPTQLAAEVSAFSEGVRLDVGVNDTTPRVGGAVLVVIRMTNVNSSTPVPYGGGLSIKVRNSEGVSVLVLEVMSPTMLPITSPNPHYRELHINQTVVLDVWVWKVETSPYFEEVTPGEDYYIVVWAYGPPIEIGPIRVVES